MNKGWKSEGGGTREEKGQVEGGGRLGGGYGGGKGTDAALTRWDACDVGDRNHLVNGGVECVPGVFKCDCL